MASRNSDDYEFVILAGDELAARVAALFAKNENPKSLEHLKWQYLDNPAGIGYTAMAVSKAGEDAAAYSVFQVFGHLNGETVRMVQSIDTLTDINHRGRGLFTKLSKAVYDACDSDGLVCVYGFPNSNSAHGFFKKLEWKNRGYPPFRFHLCNLMYPVNYVLKLKSPRLSNGIFRAICKYRLRRDLQKSGAVISTSADFRSEEYATLWNKFANFPGLKVSRDVSYMQWRYKEKPGNLYQYISIRGKDGLLQCVLVFRIVDKHGGKLGYIMDVVADPSSPFAADIATLACALEMYDQKVDAILAWDSDNSPLQATFRHSLFIKMARNIQPIKLHFGIRPFSSAPTNLTSGDIYVSYADSDTV